MNSSKICILCNVINNLAHNTNKRFENYNNFSSVFPEELVKNFPKVSDLWLIPDRAPVYEGHTLIVPQEHLLSFTRYKCKKNLMDGINYLSNSFSTPNFILFEHGTGVIKDEVVGCGNSIYHAHMHFIPIINNKKLASEAGLIQKIYDNILSEFGSEVSVSVTSVDHYNLLEFLKNESHGNPYLFVYDSTNRAVLLMIENSAVNIYSQYLRKQVAIQLIGENAFWDWKNDREYATNHDLIMKRLKFWWDKVVK